MSKTIQGTFDLAKSKAVIFATSVFTPIATFASEGSSTTRQIDLTGVDLMAPLDQVYALIPQVLPAVFGFVGLRKGISFILSSVRGA